MVDSPEIKFLRYRKPPLEAGNYVLNVASSIQAGINDSSEKNEFELKFQVQSERYSLNETLIYRMYPPPGRLGRYNDCLPHIAITRSSYPWELSAFGNEAFEPWVTLLVFDQEELDTNKVVIRTVNEADSAGSDVNKSTVLLDVQCSLLKELIPSGKELQLQSHVRLKQNSPSSDPETEMAIVVANRLPKPGSNTHVHLVSVEDRYCDSNQEFNFMGKSDSDFIELTSLKSWQFTCFEHNKVDFESLVEQLDVSTLSQPEIEHNLENENQTAIDLVNKLILRGYCVLPHKLRQADTTFSWFRGPLHPTDTPTEFKTLSDLPDFSDGLTRYIDNTGMFDMSYSAAFQLGRALALDDVHFSSALYQWKHHENEHIHQNFEFDSSKKLTVFEESFGSDEHHDKAHLKALEEHIKSWLHELSVMEGVPFNYLVPNEAMLPKESVRFFKLDQHWLECLLYGAFSIGGDLHRVSENTTPNLEDYNEITHFITHLVNKEISGFIVRSQLVADYPDLLCNAYPELIGGELPLTQEQEQSKMPFVKKRILGPDSLLCLYEGKLLTAELYLKPEGLHFGLDVSINNEQRVLEKDCRTDFIYNSVLKANPNLTVDKTLEELANAIAASDLAFSMPDGSPISYIPNRDGSKFAIPVKNQSPEQPTPIIDIDNLNQTFQAIFKAVTTFISDDTPSQDNKFHSGHFGMYMLEGQSKGRFIIHSQDNS